MTDLSENLHNVWSALANVAGGNGASVMFIGAKSGDGASLCAKSFAKLATSRAVKSVWLLDLDFYSDGQIRSFGNAKGTWTGPYDMTFGASPFWRATPRSRDGNQGLSALVGYRYKNSKLFVSKFRKSGLSTGQTIQIGPSPEYFAKLKTVLDVVIIDAPALERSRAGLALVSQIDGVVLVVDGDKGDPRDSLILRDEILSAGGRCLGVVVVNNSQFTNNRNANNAA